MNGALALLLAAFVTLVNPELLLAQFVDNDNLLRVLRNTELSDSLRLDALNTLSFRLRLQDTDSSIVLAREQLTYSRSIDNAYFQLQALARLSDAFRSQENNDSLTRAVEERLKICRDFNPGPVLLAKVYEDAASLAMKDSDLATSLDFVILSITTLCHLNQRDLNFFYKLRDKGLVLAELCHAFDDNTQCVGSLDSMRTRLSSFQMAGVVHGMGVKMRKTGQYESARRHFREVLHLLELVPDTSCHRLMHLAR